MRISPKAARKKRKRGDIYAQNKTRKGWTTRSGLVTAPGLVMKPSLKTTTNVQIFLEGEPQTLINSWKEISELDLQALAPEHAPLGGLQTGVCHPSESPPSRVWWHVIKS